MAETEWECLVCGWKGLKSELKEIKKFPESIDALYIARFIPECCPSCESSATEPIENHNEE